MKGAKIINGDVVRENGSLVVIAGLQYYGQRIRNAIKLQVGEVSYETTSGIDWLTIFSEPVSRERILREIRRVIKKDSETIEILELTIQELDRENRNIKIFVSVKTIYGVFETVL